MVLQLARWMECKVVALYSKRDAVLAKDLGVEVVVMYDEEWGSVARVRESGTVYVAIGADGGRVLESAFGCVKDGGMVVSIANLPEKELVEKKGKSGVPG